MEEIGSGGEGVVFRATYLWLDTDIVVKKIKDEVFGKIDIAKSENTENYKNFLSAKGV